MLNKVAAELINRGFDVVPDKVHGISKGLIEDASFANQYLIRFLAELDCPTKVYRPGEVEAEVGLVHLTPEDGKDIKYFLHTAHDFLELIKAEPRLARALRKERKQVEIILELYHQLTHFVLGVLTHIEMAVEFPLLEDSLKRSFVRSCRESLPDNTTILRGLLYQAAEGHKGARLHPDRSFITPHCGDFGGTLLAHQSMTGEKSFSVSPGAGEITIFLGAKAEIASDGELRALWHSATTRPDEDRTAMVMFAHVVTPEQIDNAKEALFQFWKAKGINDPNERYKEFFNR